MAKGRLWFKGKTVYVSVTDATGQVVWSDNTGRKGWQQMLAILRQKVWAYTEVETAGQLFRSWKQIVHEAKI